jgi:hypothetical protein
LPHTPPSVSQPTENETIKREPKHTTCQEEDPRPAALCRTGRPRAGPAGRGAIQVPSWRLRRQAARSSNDRTTPKLFSTDRG